MSEEHKAALAEGRRQGVAVRRYLEALERSRATRGRPARTEDLEAQLAKVEGELEAADALRRLHLLQQRRTLRARLLASEPDEDDLAALEAAFIEVAADYSARKNIDYATWREAGVPAEVLRRAGIAARRR
jgi:hypothetical protein